MTDLQLGEFYSGDELPENKMERGGEPSWVSDKRLAISLGQKSYELKMYHEMVYDGTALARGEKVRYKVVEILHFNDDLKLQSVETADSECTHYPGYPDPSDEILLGE